ncbi:MAG: hypothetical protein K2J71_01555 [Oscillospiraceae bacterium]|nr:hypothetical protein [Oscillospiraceae bacterium]
MLAYQRNTHIRMGRVFGTPQNDDVTHIAGSTCRFTNRQTIQNLLLNYG